MLQKILKSTVSKCNFIKEVFKTYKQVSKEVDIIYSSLKNTTNKFKGDIILHMEELTYKKLSDITTDYSGEKILYICYEKNVYCSYELYELFNLKEDSLFSRYEVRVTTESHEISATLSSGSFTINWVRDLYFNKHSVPFEDLPREKQIAIKIQEEKDNIKMSEEGRKFDSGKPRWGLLPFRELKEVVEILTFGAEKYAENNWQKVKPTSRYIDAAFRHFTAWCSGEKTDPESGKSHLAHAVCNLLFLMWFDNEEKTNA